MRTIARTASRATTVAFVVLGVTVAGHSGAQAKDKIALDVSGYSAPSAPVSGVFGFSGPVKGDPFHGLRFTGSFGPDDGTLPQARACEPASGTMTISDQTGSVTLAVSGEMCENRGTYPTFGSWSVADADGAFRKAKGGGLFSWNAQLWGTLWSTSGQLKM